MSAAATPASPFLDQALTQVGRIESLCTFTQINKLVTAQVRLATQWVGIGRPARQTVLRGQGVAEVSQVDPLVAKTVDPEIWHGLGIVGLWAAIDAFREHKPTTAAKDIETALASDPALPAVWGELDDMRHLFAHNFAGQADDYYWYADGPARQRQRRRGRGKVPIRYRFTQPGVSVPLTSGTGSQFDGATNTVRLTVEDLSYYVEQARAILRALDLAWP